MRPVRKPKKQKPDVFSALNLSIQQDPLALADTLGELLAESCWKDTRALAIHRTQIAIYETFGGPECPGLCNPLLSMGLALLANEETCAEGVQACERALAIRAKNPKATKGQWDLTHLTVFYVNKLEREHDPETLQRAVNHCLAAARHKAETRDSEAIDWAEIVCALSSVLDAQGNTSAAQGVKAWSGPLNRDYDGKLGKCFVDYCELLLQSQRRAS